MPVWGMMVAAPTGAYGGPGSMPEYGARGVESEATVAPARHSRVSRRRGERGRCVAGYAETGTVSRSSVATSASSGTGRE